LTDNAVLFVQQHLKNSSYEHIAQEWLPISELKKLDWAAADIPIVNKLVMDKIIQFFNSSLQTGYVDVLSDAAYQPELSIKKSSKKSTFNNTSRT
jgi:hypothetical protein